CAVMASWSLDRIFRKFSTQHSFWKMIRRKLYKPRVLVKSARSAIRIAAPLARRSRSNGAPNEHGIISPASKPAGIVNPAPAGVSCFHKVKCSLKRSSRSNRSKRFQPPVRFERLEHSERFQRVEWETNGDREFGLRKFLPDPTPNPSPWWLHGKNFASGYEH